MRYLAIDLGGKRMGLAVGDDETGIVSPVDVVHTAADTERLAAIRRAVDEYGPDELVLGLPLNMDGSEGPAAKSAQQWGAQLAEAIAMPVRLHDERLTSAQANDQMARTGLTRGQKKNLRDALAAANILRGFLESRSAG